MKTRGQSRSAHSKHHKGHSGRRKDEHKHPAHHPEPPPGEHHHIPGEPLGHEHAETPPFVPPLKPGDPGPKSLKKIKGNVPATYLYKSESKISVMNATNPNPYGSLGFIDRFIELSPEGKKKFPAGTLVVLLDLENLGSVAIESLRLFHWKPETKKYELVPHSRLGQTEDYVWGKITEPGIYAVIGVNADPLVARTLTLMKYFHTWLHVANAATSRKLHNDICALILGNSSLHNALKNRETARRFVEDNLRIGLPGKWPGGVPPTKSPQDWKKLLEICRSPKFPHQPPEAELIEAHLDVPEDVGTWEVLPLGSQGSQVLAVHAALVQTGKVVYFSGDEHDQHQSETGQVDHTRSWDPNTSNIQTLGSPAHDLFCCGHAFLGNGRLLVAGGTEQWNGFRGLRNATIFNPKGGVNPWTPTIPMNPERGKTTGGGRWYPSLITLPNGRIFTMSGIPKKDDTRNTNIMIEVYKGDAWLDMGDKPTSPNSYPRLHLLPNGKVYCSTVMGGQTQTWDPVTKTWANVAPSPGSEYEGFTSSAVLLPLLPEDNHRPRVMVIGGPQPKIIDLSAATPSWQNTAPRTLTGSPLRRHVNSVLLPDANVLVVGGSETNQDADAVLEAELYKPATDQWLTLATSAVPRVYHSVALLLPDGRVWTCGSNFNSNSGVANRELRMEIFSPPYLFQGPRPTITSAPNMVNCTKTPTFSIQTPDAAQIATVNLIRCGSVTHAFNYDQRCVKLAIQSVGTNSLTVASPPNGNIAPRGFYLLFLINNNGIPSLGRFLKIKSK